MLSRSRFYYGWLIVIAGFLVLYVSYSVHYSFGVFLPELEKALAPGQRAAISLGFSVYSTMLCFLSLFSGGLTDRWGPRPVLIVGGLLLGGGTYMVGQAQSLWQYYLAYALSAVGMSTTFVPATSTAVKWFVERRGLAVGLVSLGGSLGQVTAPIFSSALLSQIGWRAVYSSYGIGLAILLGLFALVMVRGPEAKGLKPYGTPANDAQVALHKEEEPYLTPREAMRTRALWLLIASLFLFWAVAFMPGAHLPSFSRAVSGASVAQAALTVTAIGIGACLGRVVGGGLSDTLGRRRTMVVSFLFSAVGFTGLLFGGKSLPLVYISAAFFGAGYGSVGAVYAAFTGDLFGRRYASSIAGLVFSLGGAATGIGVYMAGAVYESTGGYSWAFAMGSILSVLAVPLCLAVRRPRFAQPRTVSTVSST